MDDREILVAPRRCFSRINRFISSDETLGYLNDLSQEFRWMSRESAELSTEWLQPIPIAILENPEQEYCILRRNSATREDLKRRLTLVVGGHVERDESARKNMRLILTETLKRELYEELGLRCSEPELVGLVVDNSSLLSSRHIGLLYVVRTSEPVKAQALEEFAKHSKYSGEFLSVGELAERRAEFDLWSKIVLEDFLAPRAGEILTTQPRLPLGTEDG